jgi:tRNA pseudouridine55 synthase
MLGVVNLDKPVGPTSHDMVDLVRRLTGMRRIGHAGTLDPLASGVLPILVGAATRFSDDLTGGSKRYEAVIRLGIRSATDDAQGPLVVVGVPPDMATVSAAVASFVGTFEQRPPAFSARKTGGVVAHRAARAGNPVEAPPRTVTVEAIDILGSERGDGWLDLRCDIRCGPGTYIRSIARDLGDRLGCGGHLHGLRRTEAAGLRADDAIAPDRLEELAAGGKLARAILPVGPLLRLPELRLDAEGAGRFMHGSAVLMHGTAGMGRHAVFGEGELLGIGMLHDGLLEPRTVIETTGAR